jgi:TonB family protein
MRALWLFVALAVTASDSLALSPAVLTPGYGQRWVVSSPTPKYPLAARAEHITGSGIFVLRIQIRSGLVKEVIVARSTGSALLDRAAVAALRKWRFKAGALPSIKDMSPKWKDPFASEDSFIKVPVHFTMRT